LLKQVTPSATSMAPSALAARGGQGEAARGGQDTRGGQGEEEEAGGVTGALSDLSTAAKKIIRNLDQTGTVWH
jgi:hypothetical protein